MAELTAAYIHEMIDSIVALEPQDNNNLNRDTVDEEAKANFVRFDAKVDEFFGELIAAPEADDRDLLKQQVRMIFNGNEGDGPQEVQARLADPDFVNGLLPEARAIAAARNLLAARKVHVYPSSLSNWDRFSDRYQDAILEA